MRRVAIGVIALVPLIARAEDPSLATTFDWLAKHVAANSQVATRQVTAQGTYDSSGRVSLAADPRSCQMSVTYENTFRSNGKTTTSVGVLSFNLKAITPASLRVVPGYTALDFNSSVVCRAGVSDFTNGTASVVATTYQNSASITHRSPGSVANIDRMCIPLASQDSADRVLEALQAACRACGCKAEPF